MTKRKYIHSYTIPKTGWPPPELMQDDCKGLSQWLSNTPFARLHAREAARGHEHIHIDEFGNGWLLAWKAKDKQ
jgi:hypothetical protein